MKTAVALLPPTVSPLLVEGKPYLQVVQRVVQFPHEAAIGGLWVFEGEAGRHGAGVE